MDDTEPVEQPPRTTEYTWTIRVDAEVIKAADIAAQDTEPAPSSDGDC